MYGKLDFKTIIEYLFNEYTWPLISQISRSLEFSKENLMLKLMFYYTLI